MSQSAEEPSPTILPLTSRVTAEMVTRACPGTAHIYACDFAVVGATDDGSPGGLRLGRILNVDHHADLPRMMRPITSTELARDHLVANGPVEPESCVVINHTDCDSILSSAMMLGVIDANDRFVTAARDADHTGARNEIADLLQALDESRNGQRTQSQYGESVRNLESLLDGHSLEPAAASCVALRAIKRDRARQLVESGRFSLSRGVAVAVLDEEIDGAFFTPLLPDATVIMVASPRVAEPTRWNVKLRLAIGAPAGMTLHALGIPSWDSNFGGRWNAGGNKRSPGGGRPGGTTMTPESYAERLRDALQAV